MKAKRTIILYAAVASLLLCIFGALWFNRIRFGDMPHAHSSGERLSFATLRPNEQIVVKSMHGDRGVRVREYAFLCIEGERCVSISGNTAAMDYPATVPLVKARPVSPSEGEGLDALVQWFRRRGEEPAIGVAKFEFTYFRDNRPIGEEFFVGYGLPWRLAYLRREAAKGAATTDDFDRLAQENSLTRPELDALVPFEALEEGAR